MNNEATVYNKMYGKVQVLEPPLITYDIHPEKDSLIKRSAEQMNFGGLSSLAFGDIRTDRYESFLSFNPKELSIKKELEDVFLILQIVGEVRDTYNLEIYESSNGWNEHTIRWNYQPEKTKNLVASFKVNPGDKEIKVDMKEYFEAWMESKEERSFVIISKEKETQRSVLSVGSKESMFPPSIRFTYYDIPENGGIAHLDSNAHLAVRTDSELSTRVNIESSLNASDLPIELAFNKREDAKEIPVDFTLVAMGYVDMQTNVEFKEKSLKSDLTANSFLRSYGELNLNSNAVLESKIKIEDINVTAVLKAMEYSYIESIVSIEEKRDQNILESNATVRAGENSEIEVNLHIGKRDDQSDIEADLFLRSYGDLDIRARANFINKEGNDFIHTGAFVRSYGESYLSVQTKIVSTSGDSELDAIFEVGEKSNHSLLPIEAIIRIRWAEELDTKATIAYFKTSELASTVDILEPSNGNYGFIL